MKFFNCEKIKKEINLSNEELEYLDKFVSKAIDWNTKSFCHITLTSIDKLNNDIIHGEMHSGVMFLGDHTSKILFNRKIKDIKVK